MSSSKLFDKSKGFQPKQLFPTPDTQVEGWLPAETENPGAGKYAPSPIYDKANNPKNKEQQPVLSKSTHTVQDKTKIVNNPAPEHPAAKNSADTAHKTANHAAHQQAHPAAQSANIITKADHDKAVAEAFAAGQQQGLEQGRINGVNEGRKQAEDDYQTSGAALLAISEQLNTTRETLLNNSIGEMQDLVIAIAEKIIRHSVTAQDDTIITTVEEALRQAVKSDEFQICLNKEDYDIIQSKAPELITSISGLENIVIKIDNNIDPGGCIIESDFCTVDASIASQLKLIEDQVKSRR